MGKIDQRRILIEGLRKMNGLGRDNFIRGVTNRKFEEISWNYAEFFQENYHGKIDFIEKVFELDETFSIEKIIEEVESISLDDEKVINKGGVIYNSEFISDGEKGKFVIWINIFKKESEEE